MAKNDIKLTNEQYQMAEKMLLNAVDIKCECGSYLFAQSVRLKRVSKIITGGNEDLHIPVPSFYCIKCLKEVTLQEPEIKENKDILDLGQFINK